MTGNRRGNGRRNTSNILKDRPRRRLFGPRQSQNLRVRRWGERFGRWLCLDWGRVSWILAGWVPGGRSLTDPCDRNIVGCNPLLFWTHRVDIVGSRTRKTVGAGLQRRLRCEPLEVRALLAVTASMTDMFAPGGDLDADGVVEPGETLRYEVAITNPGGPDAVSFEFTDTLDGNTTLDESSIQVSPLANDDTYNAVGNTRLTIGAASGVLSNDLEFLGETVGTNAASQAVIDSFDANGSLGGTLNLQADGSFTYDAPTGTEGVDAFSYTLKDPGGLTGTATISITVDQVVWYIDNTAGAGGSGTAIAPFQTVAEFNSQQGGGQADDPEAGDIIYIREGNGTDYDGAFVLLDNQQLIGQGVDLTVNHSVAGPIPLESATSSPTLTNTSGDVVRVANGNTIKGLIIDPRASSGIEGSPNGLTVEDVEIKTGGGGGANDGIALTNASGSVLITNVDITGTTSGRSVDIDGGDAVIDFDGTGQITQTGGQLIDVRNLTGGSVDFGSEAGDNYTLSGTDAVANGLEITGSAGAVTIPTVDMDNASLHGIFLKDNSGTISILDGTIDASGADGVFINNSNAILDSLTINGGQDGIEATSGADDRTLVITNSNIGNTTPPSAQGIDIRLQQMGSFTVTMTDNTLTSFSESFEANGDGAGASAFIDARRNIFTTTSTADTVEIDGSTLNPVNITTFLDNAIIANGTSGGIDFREVVFDADPGSAGFQPVSGGTLNVGDVTGTITASDRVSNFALKLVRPVGSLNFTTLNLANANGIGLGVDTTNGGSPFTLTGGGGGTIDTVAGIAMDLLASPTTGPLLTELNLGTVKSSDSTTRGVRITGVGDAIPGNSVPAISVATLDIDNPATEGVLIGTTSGDVNILGGDITGATKEAFKVGEGATANSGGDADISYGGTINNTADQAVNVKNRTGGTILFSGAIVDSGLGIVLEDNDQIGGNGTITFSGGLSLDTGANTALKAIDGGTVNVTGTANTINVGAALALNIADTDIGASNLTFRSISADGSATAISLSNTGTAGGLEVSGDGSANRNGSGGIIENTTGTAIVLNNTANVELNNMRITRVGGHAVSGSDISDGSAGANSSLEINHTEFIDIGDETPEDVLSLVDITGTMAIDNSLFQDFEVTGVDISNNSGALTINIDDSTFDDNDDTNGADAIRVQTAGSAGTTLNVTDSTFDDIERDIVQTGFAGTGSHDVVLLRLDVEFS